MGSTEYIEYTYVQGTGKTYAEQSGGEHTAEVGEGLIK
jgi:hypothetical protein